MGLVREGLCLWSTTLKIPDLHSDHRGPGSGLLFGRSKRPLHLNPQNSLVPAYSLCGCSLVLLLWSSLSLACSSLGRWLRPVSEVVPGLGPLPRRSLGWARSCKGLWLWSTPSVSQTRTYYFVSSSTPFLFSFFPTWCFPFVSLDVSIFFPLHLI